MGAGARLAAGGFYPERDEAPEGAFDRFAAFLGHAWRRVAARSLGDQSGRATQVREHAARFRDQPLAGCLAGVRYRLRRDDFHPDAVAECHGAIWAALVRRDGEAPAPHVLGAADRLVQGGIAELARRDERTLALAMAAATFAAYGAPVHVLAASDARAASLAGALQPLLADLGLAVAVIEPGMGAAARQAAYASPIVCSSWREVALNYLQDQLGLKGPRRRLGGRIARLGAPECLLRGLACALVDDADAVMIDEAATPAVIAAEADRSADRLLYEQSLELARTLVAGADFALDEGRPRLTAAAEQHIERFLAPLGGAWAAAGRRRQLIETALEALHGAATPQDEADADDAAAQDLRGMRELKEGRRLSARRDVLARLPAARFLRRYVHLAGVCQDARGIEAELWSLYRLDATRAGARAPRADLPVRVFATAAEKHAAVAQAVREDVVVAVSSPAEAQALLAAGIAQERLSLHPTGARLAARPAGGSLHLIVAETHDAERHLQRLLETYAATSGEIWLSLEDDAVAGSALADLLRTRPRRLAALAQSRAAAGARLAREEAHAREQTLADLLAFSGAR